MGIWLSISSDFTGISFSQLLVTRRQRWSWCRVFKTVNPSASDGCSWSHLWGYSHFCSPKAASDGMVPCFISMVNGGLCFSIFLDSGPAAGWSEVRGNGEMYPLNGLASWSCSSFVAIPAIFCAPIYCRLSTKALTMPSLAMRNRTGLLRWITPRQLSQRSRLGRWSAINFRYRFSCCSHFSVTNGHWCHAHL